MHEVDVPKARNKKGIFERVVDKIVKQDQSKVDEKENEKKKDDEDNKKQAIENLKKQGIEVNMETVDKLMSS